MELFSTVFLPQYIFGAAAQSDDPYLRWWIMLGIAGGFVLFGLVLGGIGLNTMAKRAGMKYGFLGFLPFANTYLAGQMAWKIARGGIVNRVPALGARIAGVKRPGLIVAFAELVFAGLTVALVAVSILEIDTAQDSFIWTGTNSFILTAVDFIFGVPCLFVCMVPYLMLYRKYSPRKTGLLFLLTFMLPLRGVVLFVLRNRMPVEVVQNSAPSQTADYYGNTPAAPDAALDRRMEELNRMQQELAEMLRRQAAQNGTDGEPRAEVQTDLDFSVQSVETEAYKVDLKPQETSFAEKEQNGRSIPVEKAQTEELQEQRERVLEALRRRREEQAQATSEAAPTATQNNAPASATPAMQTNAPASAPNATQNNAPSGGAGEELRAYTARMQQRIDELRAQQERLMEELRRQQQSCDFRGSDGGEDGGKA